MKKVKHLFSFLIAFFLGGILFPFTVKASAPMPTPTQGTMELVNIADELLTSLMITEHHIFPVTSNLSGFNGSMNFGALPYSDLWNWDSSDFTVSALSNSEYTALLNQNNIYDSLGIEINSINDIYKIEFDNGLFHGNGYIDSNGNILYTTDNLGGQLLNVAIGGNQVDATQFLNNLSGLADDIIDNNMSLVPSNFNITENSYYCYLGRRSVKSRASMWIYCPDIYNVGVCVSDSYTNGQSLSKIYVNDLSAIQYGVVDNYNNSGMYDIYQGNYNVNGTRYKYQIYIHYLVNNNSSSDYNNYKNSTSGTVIYNFSQTQFSYDTSLMHNSDSIQFKQVDFEGNSKVVNDPYANYNYSDLQKTYDDIDSLASSKNNNFNPIQAISPANYPDYTPIPQNISLPQTTPLPDPPPISDPDITPVIEPMPDPIDPTVITNDIPLVSGLQNKFPFSIPWDIYNLVKGLSVPREIPVLEYEIEFPIINYTWEISIDLTMYNDTAILFRTLFLITFIIGLAVFSYNHFFGT